MSRRWSGQRAWFAAPLVALALSRDAAAVPNDRLAVEILPNETTWDATLAFDRACYRAGVSGVHARPAQIFTHANASFVRLSVEGPEAATHCLNTLDGARRGVTGAAHWFDGFAGGLVVHQPPNQPEDRVPDAEWLDPKGRVLEPAAVDDALLDQLSRGSAEALQKLNGLPPETALATVEGLAGRSSPSALAVLELVARQHPQWRVRRAAVEALNPLVSTPVLIDLARRDPAWEVRVGAVEMLQTMANTIDPASPARSSEATKLVVSLMEKDPAWEVRRQAIWTLSTELVNDAKDTLRDRMKSDPEPKVRATALETLAGAHQLSESEARRSLTDSAPEVRAVAALALATMMRAGDAPLLWRALQDPDRIVRLAASTFLPRIQDPTIGPKLWRLYVDESELLDADPAFQQVVLDALGRAPFPELPQLVSERLGTKLSPQERRILGSLFAKLNPQAAEQQALHEMQSPDASTRALAAEIAPATSQTKERRIELLQDADSDVRASAILGLCRSRDGAAVLREISNVAIDLTPLGQEAALARPHCGAPETPVPTLQTALEATGAMPVHSEEAAFWPALTAIVLMFLSVFVIKFTTVEKKPAEATSEKPTA